jgi:hypothetical protein
VPGSAYRGRDVARCWAGFASLGAGLVHAAVIREHWSERAVYGVFFAVVAAGQLGWGLAALARDRAPFPGRVAAANGALIALWALTRTVGLPFGPDAGTPEAVGAADLGAVALQGILVVAVAVGGLALLGVPRASKVGLLGGLAAGALLVGLITTPALAGTPAGAHAHPHGAAHGGAQPSGHHHG